MPRIPYRFGGLDDDAKAVADILAASFDAPTEYTTSWLERAGHDHVRVLREGPRPVAALLRVPMGQFFGGRVVTCTGIAGVGVAADARGRGAGAALMRHALRELSREGTALSALYPATQTLYARVGYGIAGARYRTEIALGAIDVERSRLTVRPYVEDDERAVRALYAEHAAARDGHLHRGPYIWERTRRDEKGKPCRGFVVEGREGNVDAYVFYRQESVGGARYDLRVADFAFRAPSAGRRLLAFLRDHRSLARSVVLFGAGAEPLVDLVPEPRAEVRVYMPFMLRLCDIPGALAQRGYPREVRARLELEVRDDVLREQGGRYVLEVEDGEGRVKRGGRGSLRIDVRALAALYSGRSSPRQLALTGGLEASPRVAGRALAVFAGPAPSMADMF